MPAKPAEIVIEENVYELNRFYCEGAQASRRGDAYWSNPYQDGSQRYADWEHGYDNEDAMEHKRFGKDLITEAEPGKRYEHDPDVVRNEYGVAPDQFMS